MDRWKVRTGSVEQTRSRDNASFKLVDDDVHRVLDWVKLFTMFDGTWQRRPVDVGVHVGTAYIQSFVV